MATSTIPLLLPLSSPSVLHLTVRFTTSIPDLLLDIPKPSQTTVVALRHLIRSNLPEPTASHRLRLIYSGKILQDSSQLSTILRVPPPPPRAPLDPKGKGKAVESGAPVRVYINCSIGDVLLPSELVAEATAATTSSLTSQPLSIGASENGVQHSSTTPAPRGFDRLLATGFTPAEVGQLRLQFRAVQASTHTPDTMPSPTTLRRMEDAWMDDNAAGPESVPGMGEGEAVGGALDDLLWGSIMGFLWPLGAVTWLSREQGVWSPRRQTAVLSGFMFCLAFGLMNILG